LPTAYDLTYEDRAAVETAAQTHHPGGLLANPRAHPALEYCEAIVATVRWLRGDAIVPPTDCRGHGPYVAFIDRR
jgi:hypothetical protein